MERNDFPLILQAKHVREIMGFSKSSVYEMFKLNGFPLLEVNGRKIVYRDRFFEWLDGKEAQNR